MTLRHDNQFVYDNNDADDDERPSFCIHELVDCLSELVRFLSVLVSSFS